MEAGHTATPTYEEHLIAGGMKALEVIGNPTHFEQIGKCHIYLPNGDYKVTTANIQEARDYAVAALAKAGITA